MRSGLSRLISCGIVAVLAALHLAAADESPVPLKNESTHEMSIDQIQALVDAAKYSEAVKKGREYLAKNKNPAVYTLVGFSLRKQNKWDEAIQSYNEALAIDAAYYPAKEYLAVAYLGKKDNAKAKAIYQELKGTDPNLAAMLKSEADKMGAKL